MFRNTRQTWRWVAMAVAIGLYCSSQADAVKPENPDEDDGDAAAYTVVDLLGLPGGDYLQSRSQSICQADSRGTVFVAGNSYAAGQWHPVLWAVSADGTFTNPLDLHDCGSNYPRASVNNAGVVVERLGYVFVPGLPPQELSTVGAYAWAVNNSDQIIGSTVYDDGTSLRGSGALWELDNDGVPGAPTLLGDFDPQDISDTGLMVGEVWGTATAAIARLEDGGLQVTYLGVLQGYDSSEANAISSDGVWVAGSCKKRGVDELGRPILLGQEAFVWSEATGMIGLGRLGDPGSEGLGVNSTGQVVGYSYTDDRYAKTAFLWQDGQLLDLNALADTGKKHLTLAQDINDAGQIVGEMKLPRPVSEEHGFVLISAPSEP